MTEEIDTQQGGESLNLDQAAAAYAKATTEPVSNDHGNVDEQDTSDGTTDDETLEADAESEGADGETESEEDPADAEDSEPETEQGRFVADNAKVRLADGTVTSVHELKRGFLREADYTRKTTETAELRKQFEGQSSALKASQEQLERERTYVTQILQAIVGQEPDIALLETDPMQYWRDKANFDAWGKHLGAIQQQDERSRQQKQVEATKAEQEQSAKAWNALLGVKGYEYLQDPKKADNFASDIRTYLESYGAKPEDMKAVALNHVYAVIADKARRWDKLQASKATVAKKVEGRPPVQKGGKRLNPNEQRARAVSDAQSRLQQSGRLDDAVALLLATQK
jgi:hypothetical protein